MALKKDTPELLLPTAIMVPIVKILRCTLKFLACAGTNAVFHGISERAKALAESVGAEAIELEKLSDFRPETGMILANSTSIGMYPEVTQSPISKVGSHVLYFLLKSEFLWTDRHLHLDRHLRFQPILNVF